jgi:hypothetical protein
MLPPYRNRFDEIAALHLIRLGLPKDHGAANPF